MVQIRYLKPYLSFNFFLKRGGGSRYWDIFLMGASIFVKICDFVGGEGGRNFPKKTSRYLWTIDCIVASDLTVLSAIYSLRFGSRDPQ